MFKDKKCPHCGRKIRSQAVFCLDCGRRIDNEDDYHEDTTGKIAIKAGGDESLFVAALGESIAENLKKTPFLSITKGPDQETVIELTGNIIIGRWRKESNVVLSDPYISRQHLAINATEDQYVLKNISKTNGTKVNGVCVDDRILQDGDVIEIGYTVMVFRSHLRKK